MTKRPFANARPSQRARRKSALEMPTESKAAEHPRGFWAIIARWWHNAIPRIKGVGCMAGSQNRENSNPEDRITPLAEQWPNLRFLGLGAWWAWIWLCYNSIEIMRFFSEQSQTALVMEMYLASTMGIALSMIASAIANQSITRMLEKHWFVVGFGVLAGAATLVLSFSNSFAAHAVFIVAAVFTGVGTSMICLKVGRVYGSVSVGESFTGGGISLILASCLYFVGIGIPEHWRVFFIAALPIMAALLLIMPHNDPYEASTSLENSHMREHPAIFKIYLRLVVATAFVAFSAGLGKGISTVIYSTDTFSSEGAITVFSIGVIAVLILATVNHFGGSKGARIVYSTLMVLGVGMMLSTCFGLSVGFLSIGKEVLWLVFSCFIAYLTFRFNLSSVRMFGIAQAVYFLSSLLGWAVGGLIGPHYGDTTIRMATGVLMAFVVVVVLIYVLPERKVGRIMSLDAHTGASVANVQLAGSEQASGARSDAEPQGQGSYAQGHAAEQAFDQDQLQGNAQVPTHTADAGLQDVNAPAAAYGEGPAAERMAAAPAAQPQPSVAGDAAAAPALSAEPSAHNAPTPGVMRATAPEFGLSGRELEILDLFAQGRSANWIADHLVISKNTVRSHLRAIYTKLGVHTRQELLDFLAGKPSA